MEGTPIYETDKIAVFNAPGKAGKALRKPYLLIEKGTEARLCRETSETVAKLRADDLSAVAT